MHVQDAHVTSTGVSSQPIAFASPVTAGSAICVVGRGSSGQTITSISDSLGNTYSLVISNSDVSTWLGIWMAVNSPPGANTITVNWNASHNPQTTIVEVSGRVMSSVAEAIDQSGSRDSAGVTNHPCNVSALTPAVNNCYVLAAGSTSNGFVSSSVEAGYVEREHGARLMVHDSLQTTATATDADWTSVDLETGPNVMAIIKPHVAPGGGFRSRIAGGFVMTGS